MATQMKLEIWVEFASTYSYLTVMRVEDVLQRAGVEYQWRPFLLGPVFQAKGWNTSPFVLDPVKGAYMWRDVQRRAERLGFVFRQPALFPANGLKAARIMTAAQNEPWCGAFAKAVFKSQFEKDADISADDVLASALECCGADRTQWFARANSPDTKDALRKQTERAQQLGIFGAPSFTVDEELFWGDDRLEDAVAFIRQRTSL